MHRPRPARDHRGRRLLQTPLFHRRRRRRRVVLICAWAEAGRGHSEELSAELKLLRHNARLRELRLGLGLGLGLGLELGLGIWALGSGERMARWRLGQR